MGRSVSIPGNAITVAFCEWFKDTREAGEQYIEPDAQDWQEYKESIADYAHELWPSLEPRDFWLGGYGNHENNVILDNSHCYIGISEYCGLSAIWIIPKQDESPFEGHNNLHLHWVNQISKKFLATFGDLRKIGTFSNGESIYERNRAA